MRNVPATHPRGRRGTILIVAMMIVFGLASMVLVLCRWARVEAMVSANHVSIIQAGAVQRGAEQYVLALLAQQSETLYTLDESYFANVSVGDAGYFWLIRPDFGDGELPLFGLVEESAKLNINEATADMLLKLPAMTDELAYSIIDWQDEDTEISELGAEDEYYLALANPYRCKNANFETIEELLLVRGASPELLYGTQAAGIWDSAFTERSISMGLIEFLTVYSAQAAQQQQQGGGAPAPNPPTQQNQNESGRINLFAAPKEVLLCLPGLDENDVSKLMAARVSVTDRADQTWYREALGSKLNEELQRLITTRSYQYTADILAVSADGRSYRRVRTVIDAMSSPARIVYRRDLTDRGWPLDPSILVSLRHGSGLGAGVTSIGRSSMGSGRL